MRRQCKALWGTVMVLKISVQVQFIYNLALMCYNNRIQEKQNTGAAGTAAPKSLFSPQTAIQKDTLVMQLPGCNKTEMQFIINLSIVGF